MTTHIFLVEDHPAMQQAYASLLDLEPDIDLCGVAETAEAFLSLLSDVSCDLVVTDLSLPGMDGIDLVGRLRSEHPDLPVIVISAHEEPLYQERAERAGARAYLRKRDLAQRLAPTIRRVASAPHGSPPPGG